MSTELPKMGFLLWVEIAPTSPHYRLTIEDHGRIIVTDTLTTVPDGRGGTEPLIEVVTIDLVAEAVGGGVDAFPVGAMWEVVSASPGGMA